MKDVCSKCHGAGVQVRTGEGGVVVGRRCECVDADRSDRLIRAARIPRRYEHCTLDSFEQHDKSHAGALRATREWVDLWPAVRHGLLFVGRPGTGKTHLAVALARALARDKGAHVLFYEQRDLLKSLQGTFDEGSLQREAEVLGPVIEAEVLVLDDVGAGRTTPWARDVMHDIISHRYNDDRPLIMTSNHETGDEDERAPRAKHGGKDVPLTLRDRLGDPLMSRIYEMCRIVRVGGKDYRSWILHARHRV